MALVSQTIPSMYNGMSQQAAAIRHDNQCELDLNVYPTVVRGASKRPASQHITKASASTLPANGVAHFIHRDDVEQYAVLFNTDQTISVFSLKTGAQKTVTYEAGTQAYLPTNPKADLSVVTVADSTFIVNKTVKVLQTAAVASGTLGVAFSSLQEINDVSTYGHGIYPPSGEHEITGDDASNLSSFYVQGDGETWREIARPGVLTTIDNSTMPHVLLRNADGTFTLKKHTWDIRTCGDDVNNPFPSFVDDYITDVFFHRNRLGFTSKENVILSESGEFFNFFRSTVIQLLDTAPIDTPASHNKVSLLKYAVPYNKSLYLFAPQTQFVLDGNNTLTNRTVGIDQATEYEIDTGVRPVGSGSTIFFASPGGAYTNIREYYVESDTVSNVAANVTAHVPKLVPRNIRHLATSTTYDVLFVASDDEPDTLYVYKYYWSGTEKIQSAWTKWTLGDDATIVGVECIENYAYVVLNRSTGTYIEKFDLEPFAVTGDLSFAIHLDRLTQCSLAYLAGSDETEISLPYETDASATPQFITTGAGQVGRLIDPTSVTEINNYTYRVPGNVTGQIIYSGVPFESVHRFSQIFARDGKGSILDGDLRLRTMTVYYEDTSYFTARVTPQGRNPQSTTWTNTQETQYTGKTVGAAALILGQPSFETGTLRFPIFSDAKTAIIELVNDSHLGCTFTKAEWEGNFTKRNRRIG